MRDVSLRNLGVHTRYFVNSDRLQKFLKILQDLVLHQKQYRYRQGQNFPVYTSLYLPNLKKGGLAVEKVGYCKTCYVVTIIINHGPYELFTVL